EGGERRVVTRPMRIDGGSIGRRVTDVLEGSPELLDNRAALSHERRRGLVVEGPRAMKAPRAIAQAERLGPEAPRPRGRGDTELLQLDQEQSGVGDDDLELRGQRIGHRVLLTTGRGLC